MCCACSQFERGPSCATAKGMNEKTAAWIRRQHLSMTDFLSATLVYRLIVLLEERSQLRRPAGKRKVILQLHEIETAEPCHAIQFLCPASADAAFRLASCVAGTCFSAGFKHRSPGRGRSNGTRGIGRFTILLARR